MKRDSCLFLKNFKLSLNNETKARCSENTHSGGGIKWLPVSLRAKLHKHIAQFNNFKHIRLLEDY